MGAPRQATEAGAAPVPPNRLIKPVAVGPSESAGESAAEPVVPADPLREQTAENSAAPDMKQAWPGRRLPESTPWTVRAHGGVRAANAVAAPLAARGSKRHAAPASEPSLQPADQHSSARRRDTAARPSATPSRDSPASATPESPNPTPAETQTGAAIGKRSPRMKSGLPPCHIPIADACVFIGRNKATANRC